MNDHKALDARAAALLEKLHALARGAPGGPAAGAATARAAAAAPRPAPAAAPAAPAAPPAPRPFAVVDDVTPGSPAEAGGLAPGDRVLSFGAAFVGARGAATPAAALATLPAAAAAAAAEGATLVVTVLRDGRTRALAVAPRAWGGRGVLGCHLAPVRG